MEDEKWVIDLENEKKYSRGYHSNLEALNTALTQCYEQTVTQSQSTTLKVNTLVATSGMHAITIAIETAVSKFNGCNLIFGNELYCDSTSSLTSRKDVNLFPVDVTDMDAICVLFEQLDGQNNILFIESCSNPSGHIFDFRMISEFRRLSKSLLVIVDNTWLTHVVLNPFEFDVDVVVASLTKYYSAGTIIAGVCLFHDKHKDLFAHACSMMRWIHISGYDCTLINHNLSTMNERLAHSSGLTVALLKELQSLNEPKLIKLTHPFLENHPSHELAKIFFNTTAEGVQLYPSCLTFNITGPSMNKFRKVMKAHQVLDYITSFGCPMSRVDPYPRRDATDKSIRVRFAVGYRDSVQRNMEGLHNILEQC